MYRFTILTLPLLAACASTRGAGSDVQMKVFTMSNPPVCDYEERGRIGTRRFMPGDDPNQYVRAQDTREMVARMGGDAVIRVDTPKEYIVIRFTDRRCTE